MRHNALPVPLPSLTVPLPFFLFVPAADVTGPGTAEIHPYNVQARAVAYAQSQGLAVTAYSSFGPLGFRVFGSQKSLTTQPLFTHPVIGTIAEAHPGSTPAQVILHWAVQRGLAVIPKADNVEKLRENLASSDITFELTEAEMKEISALDLGLRFNDPADVSLLSVDKPPLAYQPFVGT